VKTKNQIKEFETILCEKGKEHEMIKIAGCKQQTREIQWPMRYEDDKKEKGRIEIQPRVKSNIL
jgi:hypothetical protein